MAQTTVVVDDPNCFIIKNATDASFVLLTASFTTGVVTSSKLSTRAVTVLTERLQDILSKAPVLADIEAGFAGLVRSLFTAVMFEAGTFNVASTYAAPTCTVTLSGLGDPCHLGIAIPMSTSSPLLGNP
jgi:hypothetical protein